MPGPHAGCVRRRDAGERLEVAEPDRVAEGSASSRVAGMAISDTKAINATTWANDSVPCSRHIERWLTRFESSAALSRRSL